MYNFLLGPLSWLTNPLVWVCENQERHVRIMHAVGVASASRGILEDGSCPDLEIEREVPPKDVVILHRPKASFKSTPLDVQVDSAGKKSCNRLNVPVFSQKRSLADYRPSSSSTGTDCS